MARIYLTQQTPPYCPNANGNFCDQRFPTYPQVKIETVNYHPDYRQFDDCNRSDISAYSVPAGKNYIKNFEVADVCFNNETQTWQFKVNNDDTLYVRQILQICNKPHILENFQQLPPNYSCADLMEDLDSMEVYSINNYVFKPILWWHEYQHVLQSDSALTTFRNDFIQQLFNDLFRFNCNSFANPMEATSGAKTIYTDVLKKYYQKSMLSVPLYVLDPVKDKDERKRLELALNANVLPLIDAWRLLARIFYCI